MNTATMTALMTGVFLGFGLMANSVTKVQAVEISQAIFPAPPTIYNNGFPNNGYSNPRYVSPSAKQPNSRYVYPPAGQFNINPGYGYSYPSYGYPTPIYGYPTPIYIPYPVYVYPSKGQANCSTTIIGSPIPSPVPINQSTGQFCR